MTAHLWRRNGDWTLSGRDADGPTRPCSSTYLSSAVVLSASIIIIIIIIIIMALRWALTHFSVSFIQESVGLLGRGIARNKACIYTQDSTNGINIDIHASSGIRTHDPSFWVDEDS
jgi:hypothetical protein